MQLPFPATMLLQDGLISLSTVVTLLLPIAPIPCHFLDSWASFLELIMVATCLSRKWTLVFEMKWSEMIWFVCGDGLRQWLCIYRARMWLELGGSASWSWLLQMASWQGTSPRASLVRCTYLWLGDSLHKTIVSHMVEPSLLAWFVIASAYHSVLHLYISRVLFYMRSCRGKARYN